MNKEEAIYLAGFFDGEGGLSIFKRRPIGKRVNPTYYVILDIRNTDLEVLSWVKGITGFGSICKSDNSSKGWKDSYRWYATTGQAVSILKEIYPYLKIKKIRADIVLEFQELMDSQHRLQPRGRGAKVLPEFIPYREELYQKVRGFNKRGL